MCSEHTLVADKPTIDLIVGNRRRETRRAHDTLQEKGTRPKIYGFFTFATCGVLRAMNFALKFGKVHCMPRAKKDAYFLIEKVTIKAFSRVL